MLENIPLHRVLFFDIETASSVEDYEELPEIMQHFWKRKSRRSKPDEVEYAEYFSSRAALFAEFSKIICISCGFFTPKSKEGKREFKIKSFCDLDEKTLLENFLGMLQNSYLGSTTNSNLCGHNIKEFDIPFICRRALINQVKVPKILDVNGLKPWERPYLDTLQLWKFGDYKNMISLHLMCHLLGVPTLKDEMNGSQVGDVYWKKKDLDQISKYCEEDVIAVARLFLKFKSMEELREEEIIRV